MVKNPASTRPSSEFNVYSELLDLASGTYFMVDQLDQSVEVTVQANAPFSFNSVSVTRSETEVSTETDLRICLSPSNNVESDSRLTISMPVDQV